MNGQPPEHVASSIVIPRIATLTTVVMTHAHSDRFTGTPGSQAGGGRDAVGARHSPMREGRGRTHLLAGVLLVHQVLGLHVRDVVALVVTVVLFAAVLARIERGAELVDDFL